MISNRRNNFTGSAMPSDMVNHIPFSRRTLIITNAMVAIRRFARIPAIDTITLARSFWRQRKGFTGVGLPQPIRESSPRPRRR